MTLDELKARLNGIEWNDIEFKAATFAPPRDIYDTVSAFSNTKGGWIVLGVQAKNGAFEIRGVADADEMQNGFIGTLRNKGKLSTPIQFKENILTDQDAKVLVFYIPQVSRAEKPVHLDGNLALTFVRKGGTTQQCQKHEVEAFLRDAAQEHFEDGLCPELEAPACIDEESLTWYRRLFQERNPDHETEGKDTVGFLDYWGLVVSSDGVWRPRRSAVLLFGTNAALHRVLRRQIVDFFIFLCTKADKLPEQRWDRRIESLAEGNILKTWRRLVEVYRDNFADSSFRVDPNTFQRPGSPPDYLAFREAVLNLLIHQDYSDGARMARLTAYADQMEFWNPGASFVCGEDWFKPGDKPVRNPNLRRLLTRIGIGEQANTGIRNLYAYQRQGQRLPPLLENDPAEHAFSVTLSKLKHYTERQKALFTRIGVNLTDGQAAIFLHALDRGEVQPLEAQALCGLTSAESAAALNHLVLQQLLDLHQEPAGHVYRPKPVFREKLAAAGGLPPPEASPSPPAPVAPPPPQNLVNPVAPVGQPATNLVKPSHPLTAAELPPSALSILRACRVAQGIPALLDASGVKSRSLFKNKHLDSLLAAGWLAQTHPDQPFHPRQAYLLTPAGEAFLTTLEPPANSSSQTT
jgi:ATP-dependent DNA helicase RecG